LATHTAVQKLKVSKITFFWRRGRKRRK